MQHASRSTRNGSRVSTYTHTRIFDPPEIHSSALAIRCPPCHVCLSGTLGADILRSVKSPMAAATRERARNDRRRRMPTSTSRAPQRYALLPSRSRRSDPKRRIPNFAEPLCVYTWCESSLYEISELLLDVGFARIDGRTRWIR